MDNNETLSNLEIISNPYSLTNSPNKKTMTISSSTNNIKKRCTFSGLQEDNQVQQNPNQEEGAKDTLQQAPLPVPQNKNPNLEPITKIKPSDIFKNMYSIDAGKTIRNIRINMRELKSTYFKNILENVKSEDNIDEGQNNNTYNNNTYNSYSNRVIKNRNFLNHFSKSQTKSNNNNSNNNFITSNSSSRKILKKNGSLPEQNMAAMSNCNSTSNINTFREISSNNFSNNTSLYFPSIKGANKNLNNVTGNNSNTLLLNSMNMSSNLGNNNLLLSNSNSQINITLLNLNQNQNKENNFVGNNQIQSGVEGSNNKDNSINNYVNNSNLLINQNSNLNNGNNGNLNNQTMHNKTQRPNIPMSLSESVLRNSVTYNQFYCPCCTHCNNLQDDYLEEHIFAIREARNVLYKAAEYTIKHNLMKRTNLDLFNSSYVNQMSFTNYVNEKGKGVPFEKENILNQNQILSQTQNQNQTQSSKLNLNLQSSSNFNLNLNKTTISQAFEKTGPLHSQNPTLDPSQTNLHPQNPGLHNPQTNLHPQNPTSHPQNPNLQPRPSPHPESAQDHLSDFESFANNFHTLKNQISSTRQTYQIVYNFLNSLLNDKINLSYFVPHDLIQKLENILLAKGLAFDEINENIFYDPELESMFDSITKDMIKNLFRKKYLQNLINMKKEDEKKTMEHRKRFTILFIIFLQLLSEISVECKERAALLYKFFKMYFCEQERKWILVVNKMKEKVHYYKDLCKTIIDQKSKHLDKIGKINDILFAQKLTKENLDDHKKLIRDLLKVNNEKKEEIYVLKANNEILTEEMKMWVYDYENVKLNKQIREELKNLQIENIIKNVNEELKHKK
jgi:hypothetical protein